MATEEWIGEFPFSPNGCLNRYLSVALNGFRVSVPKYEATPQPSPWLVHIKSHISFFA